MCSTREMRAFLMAIWWVYASWIKPMGDWGLMVQSKVDARWESWRVASRRVSEVAFGV